jgi:homoserine dehydrogenase
MNANFNIVVIKLGSSILPDITAIPNAIHEVYQYYSAGNKVVVVISAMGKTTDKLIDFSQQVLDDPYAIPQPQALAELLATGEIAAAALFTLALDRAGIPAYKLDHKYLQTEGSLLDSEPQTLQKKLILNLFKQYSVLVIPGFIGENQQGSLALLGRGGSDFSAVFIAHSLNAKQCIIYKDTNGIFNQDPNIDKLGALPYQTITYNDCLQIAYPVIQRKAVKFAKAKQFSFIVKTLASKQGTTVGAPHSVLGINKNVRKLKIIVLGLGTVGFGVYQHLSANENLFEIVGIGIQDKIKHEHLRISKNIISTNLTEIITRECDVVIELLGGIEPSKHLITQALLQGRQVITANKALIAQHGLYLSQIAAYSKVNLLFSSAVAGSLPIIETVQRFKKNPIEYSIQSITGILNGTSNFILDRIRAGEGYDEAIKSAQIAGFSEADPSLDLDGTDALHKIIILARLAFNQEALNITIEGIQNINADYVRNEAKKNHFVRLVASCELKNNVCHASIKLCSLSNKHPLAHIPEANNAVLIRLTNGEMIELHGKGAGRWPTAEAVFADLLHLFHNSQKEIIKQTQPDQSLQQETRGVSYESLDAINSF